MIHRYEIPCMDLQQIHQSGQCFRMVPLPEHTYPSGARNGYRLISGLCVLRAWQDGPFVCLDCPHEDLSFWLSYLDMGRDYQAVIASIDRENTYLKAAAMSGTGIRILHQDPWEMIITFVISQQRPFPTYVSWWKPSAAATAPFWRMDRTGETVRSGRKMRSGRKKVPGGKMLPGKEVSRRPSPFLPPASSVLLPWKI